MSQWLSWGRPSSLSSSNPASSSSPADITDTDATSSNKAVETQRERGKEEKQQSAAASSFGLYAGSTSAPAADVCAEESKAETATASSSSSSSSSFSWFSLPSLSAPSFFASAASAGAASAAAGSSSAAAVCEPPSISSSPSSNIGPAVVLPPPSSSSSPTPSPSDVSYLRSLLSSFTSSSSSASCSSTAPPAPTSGVTPSGLQWQKVEGVTGFTLSSPPAAGGEEKKQEQQEQLQPHAAMSQQELEQVKQICQQLQNVRPPTSPPSLLVSPSAAASSSSTSSSLSSATAVESPSARPAAAGRSHVVINSDNEVPPSFSTACSSSALPSRCSGSAALDSNTDEEVAVVDLDNVEWWTLVDPTRDKEAAAQYSIEEGYVVVQHSDTVDALSSYLASILHSHPDAARLTPDQLRRLIEQALKPVERPTGFSSWCGGYLTYGYYTYLAWSWGSTAWSLYQRPWLIKIVASGAFTAASWILVLFV